MAGEAEIGALGPVAGVEVLDLPELHAATGEAQAGQGLLDELRVYGQEKFKLGSLCLDGEHLLRIREWQEGVREHGRLASPDPAQHAAREDALQTWLSSHGVTETWKIAPELAELRVNADQLEPLGEFLTAESLSIVLAQFASSVRAERIAEAMLDSTARIFDLIRAIKDYSYMGQAPIQEIDVRQGLENTLAMLQSRLANVEMERRYAPDVPLISAYGSELNQVWTALLENALDAIRDRGRITIGVQISGDMLLIEVWDNGPGIPRELQDRIFEPFYTTKAPGLGLGLGLDTAQRVIRRHRGYITVQSEPGATCFQVRLPIDQLQAY